MPSRVRRAFTLVEVLVASATALLLSATLGRLFYNSLRWQARALRQTSLQQQLKVAMQRVSSELQESAPSGIAVASNEVCIQKLTDVSVDIPPRRYWATELGVYFVDSGGLHRRTWPPAPPDLGVNLNTAMAVTPDAAQLARLRTGGRSLLLGRNVNGLTVTSPRTMPIEITVTVADGNDHLSSTRVLSLRNAE